MRCLIVLALVSAVLADIHYHYKPNRGYRDLKHPDKRCHKLGQFLPHEHDDCKYVRCDFGTEPWRNDYGKVSFYAQEMWCPPGRGVDRHQKYFNFYDPCPVSNYKCGGGHFAKPHVHKPVVHDNYGHHGHQGSQALHGFKLAPHANPFGFLTGKQSGKGHIGGHHHGYGHGPHGQHHHGYNLHNQHNFGHRFGPY